MLEARTLPIRLLPTPPTCRVLPGSGVKLCVGRCGDVARDAEQGTEGVERIEPTASKPTRELLNYIAHNGAADRRGRSFNYLSAAGRNASSSCRRSARCFGKATMFLADFMQPCLEPIEGRITAAGLDQVVVGVILNQAAALNGDDPVCHP